VGGGKRGLVGRKARTEKALDRRRAPSWGKPKLTGPRERPVIVVEVAMGETAEGSVGVPGAPGKKKSVAFKKKKKGDEIPFQKRKKEAIIGTQNTGGRGGVLLGGEKNQGD